MKELDQLPEAGIGRVLAFIEILKSGQDADAALASEGVLARDWLRSEEDAGPFVSSPSRRALESSALEAFQAGQVPRPSFGCCWDSESAGTSMGS